MTETVLTAIGLSRYFGGLAAVKNVSLELRRGELHAVLGPNGAGKSTLINLLSGDLMPSTGIVRYRDIDISTRGMDARSRLGIGRSYQRTNIFPDLSVYEHCRLAAQSRTPRAAWIFSDANLHGREIAERALRLVGLKDHADKQGAALSHGDQRRLEIAMVLATEPQVLLLDEPLAGMGTEEAEQMAQLLDRLSMEHAVMLIEHDIDTVFAIADRITVMTNGEILESGTPDSIRASHAVQQVYLGENALRYD